LNYKRFELKALVGIGDYMTANYKTETFKFPLETYIKVQPFQSIPLFIAHGVLIAPFSYETAMSKDQLLYIRSLAAENAPYYVYGTKLSLDITKTVKLHGYLIQRWQEIKNYNTKLAGTLQLEYNPDANTALNFNLYGADESGSSLNPSLKNRFFLDASIKHGISDNLLVQSAASLGRQTFVNSETPSFWYQGNILVSRGFKYGFRSSARVEYFNDPSALILQQIFSSKMGLFGFTAGLSKELNGSIIRQEARILENTTGAKVFPSSPGNSFSTSNFSLNLSLVNWF